MKKHIVAVAALIVMLGLTACGEVEKSEDKTEKTVETTTVEETTVEESAEEEANDAVITEIVTSEEVTTEAQQRLVSSLLRG